MRDLHLNASASSARMSEKHIQDDRLQNTSSCRPQPTNAARPAAPDASTLKRRLPVCRRLQAELRQKCEPSRSVWQATVTWTERGLVELNRAPGPRQCKQQRLPRTQKGRPRARQDTLGRLIGDITQRPPSDGTQPAWRIWGCILTCRGWSGGRRAARAGAKGQ